MPIVHRRRPYLIVPLVLLGALSGCSSDPVPPNTTGGNATVAEPGKSPESADVAVRTVMEGLQRNHPEVLWDFLPAGQQRELNEVLHDFAQRMDPEMWGRGVQVVRKLADVIKTKKAFLSELLSNAEGGPAPDWDELANLLRSLTESELGDLDRLKVADTRKVLAVTGGSVMRQWQVLAKVTDGNMPGGHLLQLSKIRATLESSNGDKAIVRIEHPDDEPRSTEFVRVEGKWIPQALADGWIEAMGETRARLSMLNTENLAATKPRVMKLLSTLDKMLDRLAETKDLKQFTAVANVSGFELAPLVGEFFGALPDPQVAEPPVEPAQPIAGRIATIIAHGNLGTTAQDELAGRLRRTLEAGDRTFLELTADDETTSIKLGPIDDIEAFAKQLDFVDVVSIDRRTRTITVKVKR